jgi:ubiquinone biosynthesis protein
MGLSQKFYEIRRLEQIASCLFRHELHYLVGTLRLNAHLPVHKRLALKRSSYGESQPQAIREAFEELGGAFLKLGQVISLRPDLVGYSLSKEFEKVLDEVPPESFKSVVEVIDKNLPHGMKTFREFNSHPIAAGSIAQVHSAVLADGTQVAVKVQRPHVKENFIQDIAIMGQLARRLSENPNLDFVDPIELLEEFKRYTLKELDFNHEAVNMVRFRRNFTGFSNVLVPRVYKEFSNDKVLVMELLEGKDIYQAKDRLNKHEKRFVVETVSHMVIKQIFEDGFFHADLHPGNIMYLKKGKIGLLDYGIVGYLDSELKEKLFELFLALVGGDLIRVADSLILINIGDKDIDREALKAGLHYALSDFYDTPLTALPIGEVFRNMIDTARKSHLKLPPNLVLLSKSLFTVDGFCRELCPGFNIVQYSKPLLKELYRKELSPKKLLGQTISTAVSMKRLLVSAPRYLENFYRQFDLIEDRVTKYESILVGYHQWMVKIAQAAIYSLLLIPLIIASALLLNANPKYFNISIYSLIGFGLSLLLVLSILKIFGNNTRR